MCTKITKLIHKLRDPAEGMRLTKYFKSRAIKKEGSNLVQLVSFHLETQLYISIS